MKTLILLRHAKSSWGDATLDDHERPLNARGRAAAPRMGAWLAAEGYRPERVLCSSAVRTRETVRRLAEGMPDLVEPEILPALYHAAPETMLAAVHGLDAGVSTAMVVAHEPGISALARLLSDPDPDPAEGTVRAFGHFPTAAAAVFTREDGGWTGFGRGTARFAGFKVPRELVD